MIANCVAGFLNMVHNLDQNLKRINMIGVGFISSITLKKSQIQAELIFIWTEPDETFIARVVKDRNKELAKIGLNGLIVELHHGEEQLRMHHRIFEFSLQSLIVFVKKFQALLIIVFEELNY